MKTQVLLWLALLAVSGSGCGGKSGTLTLRMVVSPNDDPFLESTQVRFTVGDDQHVTTVVVQSGHFTYSSKQKPLAGPGPILVEALNASGAVVARGRTPPLPL